jgi:hypothetical protein
VHVLVICGFGHAFSQQNSERVNVYLYIYIHTYTHICLYDSIFDEGRVKTFLYLYFTYI